LAVAQIVGKQPPDELLGHGCLRSTVRLFHFEQNDQFLNDNSR